MKNIDILEKEFQTDEFTSGLELIIEGELLYEDAREAMVAIPEMVRDRGSKIIMNLRRLDYIDSSGLGALLFVSEALRMQGQSLEITNANAYNTKVLKTINRVGTFNLIDSEGAVVEKTE